MWVSLSFLVILVVKATAYNSISSEVIQEKFRESWIVNQIIPKAPLYLLTVLFGPCRVNLGTTLPVCITAEEPLVSWPYPNDDILYTLILFTTSGSLARNRTELTVSQLVCNIRGGNVQQGDPIVPFHQLIPPLGGGLRRYIWLVYKQVEPMEINAALLTRFASTYYRNFNLAEFVAEFNLDLIAGNFIRNKRTLCDATCCPTTYESCTDSCAVQGCGSSSSKRYNSYDTSKFLRY